LLAGPVAGFQEPEGVAKSDLPYNENEIQFHLPIRQGVPGEFSDAAKTN
jgi:hypothetical protein